MNKNIISVAAIAVALLSIALVQTASARTNDVYGRGLNDAYRDWNGLKGHGYDPSCPSGHSDTRLTSIAHSGSRHNRDRYHH